MHEAIEAAVYGTDAIRLLRRLFTGPITGFCPWCLSELPKTTEPPELYRPRDDLHAHKDGCAYVDARRFLTSLES